MYLLHAMFLTILIKNFSFTFFKPISSVNSFNAAKISAFTSSASPSLNWTADSITSYICSLTAWVTIFLLELLAYCSLRHCFLVLPPSTHVLIASFITFFLLLNFIEDLSSGSPPDDSKQLLWHASLVAWVSSHVIMHEENRFFSIDYRFC